MVGAEAGNEKAVARVLEREIRARYDPQPHPEVPLLPASAHARRRERPAALDLGLGLRVADRRRQRRQELAAADRPDQGQLDAPRGLAFVAAAVQAGDLLVDVLAEEGEAAPVEPGVGAKLPLVAAGDRQRGARIGRRQLRPVEQIEVAAVERAFELQPLGQLAAVAPGQEVERPDRKSTRLNSSHLVISYAVFCLNKNTVRIEIVLR